MAEGLGYNKLQALLAVFGGGAAILKADARELSDAAGIEKGLAGRIAALNSDMLADEARLMKKRGVRAVGVFDGDYPENLKNIYSPPILLYVKGEIRPEDCDAVAVVGTRAPSHYGLSSCERISSRLASRGITVVSGLARGIDTMAHKGALACGRTIAVLGNGLGDIYPPENARLADKICERGAVISEFPMSRPPHRFNFPKRNRVISGLALGVVVVEASERSGSLITAAFALEENREVFAVPGEIGSRINLGSNRLIKEGAGLVEDTEDIIQGIKSSLKRAGKTAPREEAVLSLSSKEEKVKGLIGREPVYIDELARKCDMPTGEIGRLLIALEFKNLIKELPGRNFVLR